MTDCKATKKFVKEKLQVIQGVAYTCCATTAHLNLIQEQIIAIDEEISACNNKQCSHCNYEGE